MVCAVADDADGVVVVDLDVVEDEDSGAGAVVLLL